MKQPEQIILDEGKYRFHKDSQGTILCDRNGELWRDFLGDKAILALYNATLELLELAHKARHFFEEHEDVASVPGAFRLQQDLEAAISQVEGR